MTTTSARQLLYTICAIITSFFFSGCFLYYYKVKKPAQQGFSTAVEKAKEENRYFILHRGAYAFAITDLQVDKQNEQLIVTLDTLPDKHMSFLHPTKNKTYKLKKPEILREIHIYTPDTTEQALRESFVLPVKGITKIEILEKDQSATTSNHVLSILGVTVTVFGLIIIIALLTKSSCPFVSGFDGEQFSLQGEIYGGAIYPSLQRDDYLSMMLRPKDEKLSIKISNELKERQYTDKVSLWCIDHDPNSRIVPDQYGSLFSIFRPMPPKEAIGGEKNLLETFNQQDNNYHDFSTGKNGEASNVVLSFTNQKNAKQAVLLLSAKNSYWLDFTYGELISKFGKHYNTWNEKQKKQPASTFIKWKDEQMLPLKVEIMTPTGWKVVTSLEAIGPLAYRSIVVPLDLNEVKGEKVVIRLSTGFMFWEVDYAAIDFSDPKHFNVHKMQPSSAYDQSGNDVVSQLLETDSKYLEQPNTGDVTTINFSIPTQEANTTRSYVLHASGYYEHVREFTGAADISFLNEFKKPGALSLLSYRRYQQSISAYQPQ